MFPFSLVGSATLGDYSVFMIDSGWLGLAVALAPLLLLATMYLANKPQPRPEPTAWRLNDGRWKRAKGRVRPTDWADAR